ncbi:MAG TPA: hypothetical protein VJ732_08150 [Bryobacteraceae bacterium]|nr:hypothetical protein [Bryobacteraceae bacterium]
MLKTVVLAAGAALILLGPVAAPAQSQAPASKSTKPYVPPKTPWGDPDLQGLWPGAIDIPLQRDPKLGTRAYLTDEEYAQRLAKKEQKKESDATEEKAPLSFGPPSYWIEYYQPGRQASLVVDPPNGRIPPLTPEAQKRGREMRGGLGPPNLASVEKHADSWLDFDLWGRCITRGLVGSMLPGNLYNKGNQILQAPGYVVIRNEMVHETRVIPLDGRTHAGKNIRMYMGDGRGHWEGNTLVVETTNFTDQTSIGGGIPHTENLRLVERIARVAPDQLSYDVTIDDPQTWTRPWTIHIPYQLDPSYKIYEYACHEANYGLLDILKGARAQEKKAAEAAGQPSK